MGGAMDDSGDQRQRRLPGVRQEGGRIMTVRLVMLALLLGVTTASSGCMVPTLYAVRRVALPGWGKTYSFREPDGTPHEGGYLVAEYSERPGVGAEYWGAARSKNELHVIPIVNGHASLPRKLVWKSAWAWGVDGFWHPASSTSTYVLASGSDPFGSGPGHWLHAGELGAIYSSESPQQRFRTLESRDRLVCRLHPVTGFDPGHVALLERLRDATDTFAGYQTFGLGGRELEVIRDFAEDGLAAHKREP
jgi:hypothetical protein